MADAVTLEAALSLRNFAQKTSFKTQVQTHCSFVIATIFRPLNCFVRKVCKCEVGSIAVDLILILLATAAILNS
jgi:hypothetical protein